jgi:hypothetical protein
MLRSKGIIIDEQTRSFNLGRSVIRIIGSIGEGSIVCVRSSSEAGLIVLVIEQEFINLALVGNTAIARIIPTHLCDGDPSIITFPRVLDRIEVHNWILSLSCLGPPKLVSIGETHDTSARIVLAGRWDFIRELQMWCILQRRPFPSWNSQWAESAPRKD